MSEEKNKTMEINWDAEMRKTDKLVYLSLLAAIINLLLVVYSLF